MYPGPTLHIPAVSVVMGIPSVRREVHSYLTDTLHSLISELSPQEKEDSVIVVLIAEASGRGQAGERGRALQGTRQKGAGRGKLQGFRGRDSQVQLLVSFTNLPW